MEEALNLIGYLTTAELKSLQIKIQQEIALRQERDRLAKLLNR